jgi:hypothetical protein
MCNGTTGYGNVFWFPGSRVQLQEQAKLVLGDVQVTGTRILYSVHNRML